MLVDLARDRGEIPASEPSQIIFSDKIYVNKKARFQAFLQNFKFYNFCVESLVQTCEKWRFWVGLAYRALRLQIGDRLLDNLDVWLRVEQNPFVSQREQILQAFKGRRLFPLAFILRLDLKPHQTLVHYFDRDCVVVLVDL